ncbi:MAG: hypothetical protein AAGK02_02605 [Pseudomonadota bacterium]
MKVKLYFLSRSTPFIEELKKHAEGAIPVDYIKSVRSKGINLDITVDFFWVGASFDPTELDKRVARFAQNGMGVIGFWTPDLSDVRGKYEICLFNRRIAVELGQSNFRNIIRKSITKALKSFVILYRKLMNRGEAQALTLPEVNFCHSKKSELFALIANSESNEFVVAMEKNLAAVKSLRQPKKRGHGKSQYFVDSRGYHFALGHEAHGEAETLMPPHNELCKIRKHLRFGVQIDPTQHYNVSLDSSNISSSDFVNCHGSEQAAASHLHLNIFPNDFIR